MNYISEILKTPVAASCDVAVCGGGFAGIAAALAAARRGADVMLIEREYALGGLGTLGLVTIYLPICDGMGNQVIFGIGEELLLLSMKHGYECKYPAPWVEGGSHEEKKRTRFQVGYNGPLFMMEAERLLRDAGVRILYGTQVCSVAADNGRINALIIENKSGRSAVGIGRAVVDATGDADIAAFAGAGTALYTRGNTLSAWYYYCNEKERKRCALGPAELTDEQIAAGKTQKPPLSPLRFTGIDGTEISEMMQLSHDATFRDWQKKHEADPTFMPDTITAIPQLRMTRRICGLDTLDIYADKRYEDSVGLISNWRVRGPVYEVPFGSLIARGCSNLLAAGRNISVTDASWEITRVIPCCSAFGEAAGAAAALFDDFSAPDRAMTEKLGASLREGGVRLHKDEI